VPTTAGGATGGMTSAEIAASTGSAFNPAAGSPTAASSGPTNVAATTAPQSAYTPVQGGQATAQMPATAPGTTPTSPQIDTSKLAKQALKTGLSLYSSTQEQEQEQAPPPQYVERSPRPPQNVRPAYGENSPFYDLLKRARARSLAGSGQGIARI
jgi:hypothetical protein